MIHYADGEQDCVTFTFEDTKCRKQDITLKLMDIDTEHLGIPDTKYSAVVVMPVCFTLYYWLRFKWAFTGGGVPKGLP